MFADVPTPLLFLLASHIQPRMFPPGHDISLQGAPATKMWMLHYGQASAAPAVAPSETLRGAANCTCR